MTSRLLSISLAMAITLFGNVAQAQAPKEIKTNRNKPVVLTNFLSAPSNCGTNPGPIPFPRLREKPSHGAVGLQIVMSNVAATDACPARQIPSIALFYTPNKDFAGKDSVQIEFEIEPKVPSVSFLITVQDADSK